MSRDEINYFDPPTDEEMIQLAWEAGVSIGWDTPEMAEYDNCDEALLKARRKELTNKIRVTDKPRERET